ncbi:MFS transporter [Agaricicola taiwanensis]|uniref:MFS transporter n=1 Tax=Agaricicola taiwanensis TaxID=591372 RepID=A0A8J2YL81_9RHOB|nr:MFS transporter [Agaricicola taiwanensis]GGE50167.1 MFS transporter [Agaricicola taiwanensis]
MSLVAGFSNFGRVLRNPNFGIYTAGNAVSLIGTWMQRITTGWLAWQLTQSGGWLGLVAFADLFPTVIIGPIAGAAADRWDRLAVTKISQVLSCVQALALFALTATGHITIELLLALTALQGVIAAFNQPARLALIPALLPRADLASAVAINSIIFNLARFIGPALAGILIATAGASVAFATNAFTFVLFWVALTRIQLTPPEANRLERPGFMTELADGFRYIWVHPGLRPIFLLMFASSLGARPVVELLPGFAERVFAAGVSGLAIMTSSVGVGAIIAGLWLGSRVSASGLTRLVLTHSLLLALSILLFAASDQLWLGIPALVAAGFSMSTSGIGVQTLIQLGVDETLRGRVLSFHGLIFRGGPALGALTMGLMSEAFGLRVPLVLGAAVVIAAWMLIAPGRERISQSLERNYPAVGG